MPKGKKTAARKGTTKQTQEKSGLFERTPRNFTIGNDIQPKRDLTRFVKWPRYIVLQRQKRVLLKRLKVPPAINQFTFTADANQSKNLDFLKKLFFWYFQQRELFIEK